MYSPAASAYFLANMTRLHPIITPTPAHHNPTMSLAQNSDLSFAETTPAQIIGYATQQTTTCRIICRRFGRSKRLDDVREVRLKAESSDATVEDSRESNAPWDLGDGGVIGGLGSGPPSSRYKPVTSVGMRLGFGPE